MARTMAADDDDNDVNGNGATGNEVEDDGNGVRATGYDDDGNDDGGVRQR